MAKVLAMQGVKVVVTALREERLLALREEIMQLGAESIVVAGDDADEATAQNVVRSALDAYGRIDILSSML